MLFSSSLFKFRHILLIAIIFTSSLVHSKDLSSRLGLGYTNAFGPENSLPSVSARYYPNMDYGFSASLGVDTQKDNSRFGFMVKMYRILYPESNMNFYLGGGAGVLSIEENDDNNSGFELTGFIGGEFFFPRLDSLGFTFEVGVGIRSISSEVRFRTIGDSPVKAGIVFYF